MRDHALAVPARASGRPLRVCLVGLIAGGYSGIPRYAAALGRGLDHVAGAFPELELELLTTPEGSEATGARTIPVRQIRFRGAHANAGPGRIALEQVHAAAARADLLHFFDLSGPVLTPWRPFVTTVHDLSVLQGLRSRRHGYKRMLAPWAVRHAHAAVAISAFVAEEATRILDADPNRLRVIHSGPGLSPRSAAAAVAAPAGAAPFFLYVGQLAASKNVPFLIEAFDAANLESEVTLLIVGRSGDGYASTLAAIEASQRRDRIRVLANVGDAELEGLYRTAIALVHPAVYEGFGFTPLEAMARGCPVVASDIPALRETAGDGAMLVPLDRSAWAEALARVSREKALRASLSASGARRVASFSWHEAATSLARVFVEVGARLRDDPPGATGRR